MTRVARATRAELDAVCELEQRASVRPWQRQVFVEELGREFSYVMGLWDEDALVAFIVYWIVRDELHILNVATDPHRRRHGFAARLVEHAVAAAKRSACACLLLEVRRSNAAAIRLYRKYGFRPIGVRANYYAEEHEDAIVMKLAC
jgi:ribosomal-protein-alanine N-acetyltransferase